MEITCLGHAGFCIETAGAIVITDPWLSPTGAFDASWFQYPRNHHMAAFVQEKLAQCGKERFLYISHEHKDHFDLPFLRSLSCRDFTLVLPKFRRDELPRLLAEYACKGMVLCPDGAEAAFPGGTIKLYVEDSELNRDSAVLVKAEGQSFLNLNDCKIHDRLAKILQEEGPIDVFTAQFSGAIWHPTCYEYPKKVYEEISRKKMLTKFEAVARAIQTLKPRVYLTSAGPAVFLDPLLLPINFEKVNIFPRAAAFLDYLGQRLQKPAPLCYEPMPGDVLDVGSGMFSHLAQERVSETNFEAYVREYAALYAGFFRARQETFTAEELETLWVRLQAELERKLEGLTLHGRIQVPFYFKMRDVQGEMLRIDFPEKRISRVERIAEEQFYSINTPSWEVKRLLDGKITWEDFTLTFRSRLNREPDVYQAVIHGFLMMEKEDMNFFCEKVLNAEECAERMIVEAGGCRYSVNRYCPHQKADLSQAWVAEEKYLVCPRHRWHFDLTDGGKCRTNQSTVKAFWVDED